MSKSPEFHNQEDSLIKNEKIPKVESYAVGGVLKELQQKLKPALQYIAFLAVMSAVDVIPGGYAIPPPETGKEKIAVKWGPVENATYYIVNFSRDGGQTWEVLGETTDTIFPIPPDKHFDTPANSLLFAVEAANDCGKSAKSDAVSVTLIPSECTFKGDEIGGEEVNESEYCTRGESPSAVAHIYFPDGKTYTMYKCPDEENCSFVKVEDESLVDTLANENTTEDISPEDPVTSDISNGTEELPPDDFIETFAVWENATNEEPPPDF